MNETTWDTWQIWDTDFIEFVRDGGGKWKAEIKDVPGYDEWGRKETVNDGR